MAEDRVQRKLTTILAADVEGYTRLMRADEEATLKTLSEYRKIIDGLITRHDGRVCSTAGDSVLAEFGSAVEAVRCATSIQEETASRNTELADDRKLMFRIGLNVGDVMVRDGDLFGDGVNVAARLDNELPDAYWSLGRIYTRSYVANLDGAKAALERAIALSPNYADRHMFLGLVLVYTGQAGQALGMIEDAMRINPHFPFWYFHGLGMAQLVLTRYEAAAHSLEKAIERNPTVPWPHRLLIAAYGHLGRRDDAEWQISEPRIPWPAAYHQ